MKQKLGLIVVLTGISSIVFAQQTNTPSTGRDDNSSFTFSESQLNENDDTNQSISAVMSSRDDAYLSTAGYSFSPMRFRVRGYDSQYYDNYLNGLRFNDAETGRFSYGLIGGLNDATRNKDGARAFEPNIFGFGNINGASNIDLRASHYAAGSKLGLAGTNRNYRFRGSFIHSTGLMKNGWAFTGMVAVRYSNEGNIEGTFYNSASYFLALEKRFNSQHSLSIATFGAPTRRGQQAASTQEAYYLANSNYYNPNWGYQNGEKRNARVVETYEPTAILTWDFKIDNKTKLVTSAGFKYGMYNTSALGWSNDAADPRPDYYKRMPSAQFGKEARNELVQKWKNDKAFRQVDWDMMYFGNSIGNEKGMDALYYQEARHNNQMTFNLSSVLNKSVNKHQKYTAGLELNSTKGMHYKTMKDLLGANKYIDLDKFAARDNGADSPLAQNDLRNPNRLINEGDIFGYNYNLFVNKGNVWGQNMGTYSHFDYYGAVKLGGTQMWREGLMQNGRAANNSYGNSQKKGFFEYAVKGGATYKITGRHFITLNVGYEERAPLAYNAFIAPRLKNSYVEHYFNTEKIFGGDLSYSFNTTYVSGRVTGYYTRFTDQIKLDAFYNDEEARFTYLSMSGMDKEHYGVEAALTWNIISNLSLTAVATYSEAKYLNNPNGTITYEDDSQGNSYPVYLKGSRVGGTPLSAYHLAANYSIKGWFLEISGNYYDRNYIDFSSYRRLGYVISKDANGNPIIPNQENLGGGFMLDASIGKYIRFKNGQSLSINLSIYNILNDTNIKTGGYEQNRGDKTSSGNDRTYVFSKNPKYYYAQGFNAFLNLGYRF